MLDISRTYGQALSELVLIIIFGAVAILVYSMLDQESGRGLVALSAFDVQLAFMFSASFVFLSGFFISVVVAYSLKRIRISVFRRIAFLTILYLANFLLFSVLFASSLTRPDLSLFVLGALVIIVSEVTNEMLWSKAGHRE